MKFCMKCNLSIPATFQEPRIETCHSKFKIENTYYEKDPKRNIAENL